MIVVVCRDIALQILGLEDLHRFECDTCLRVEGCRRVPRHAQELLTVFEPGLTVTERDRDLVNAIRVQDNEVLEALNGARLPVEMAELVDTV